MSIAQMREAILEAYPWPTWARKVAKMSEKQVYATYMRMMNDGTLKRNPNPQYI